MKLYIFQLFSKNFNYDRLGRFIYIVLDDKCFTQKFGQRRSNNSIHFVVLLTTLSLASFVLASFSFVHASYSVTFQDKGVVGFVYPDSYHRGAYPLYRWQNWDTGAFEFSISTLYSPNPATSYAQLHHLTFPTVTGYLATPGEYVPITGTIFPINGTTPTIKTVPLYSYFNLVTKEMAFSLVRNDPVLRAEGFDWLGWLPPEGHVFPTKVVLCNPSCVSTAPLHDFLIDGKHHFYSIHPREVMMLGHRPIP